MKEIILTRKQIAIVDDSDYELLKFFRWQAKKIGDVFYACRTIKVILEDRIKTQYVLMHRTIMGIEDPNTSVDHINGNTLDNRKINLRFASKEENGRHKNVLNKRNTSGYRGVSFKKNINKWTARVYYTEMKKEKYIHLGYFDTAQEAAKAFDKIAKEKYGEFCGKLNFKE